MGRLYQITHNINLTVETIQHRPFPRPFVVALMSHFWGKPVAWEMVARYYLFLDIDSKPAFNFHEAHRLVGAIKFRSMHGTKPPRSLVGAWLADHFNPVQFAEFAIAKSEELGYPLHPIHGSQVCQWVYEHYGFRINRGNAYHTLPGLSFKESYTEAQLHERLTHLTRQSC